MQNIMGTSEQLSKERDYYKNMVKDLGAKLHRTTEENGDLRRVADRYKTTASLLRRTYNLTNVAVKRLPEEFVRLLVATMRTDAAAIFDYDAESGRFVLLAATGFPRDASVSLDTAPPMPPFAISGENGATTEVVSYLQEQTGMQHVLWVFLEKERAAMLVADAAVVGKERPFFKEDRETAEGALHVFLDILARQRSALELAKTNAQLEESMKDLTVALDQANESSRLKSEFVANLSHELRTPLNIIVNVPDLLLQRYETRKVWHCPICRFDFDSDAPIDETAEKEVCPDCGTTLAVVDTTMFVGEQNEQVSFLGRLKRSAVHLKGLVDDLLDFSKLEANKMRLNSAEVDLSIFFSDLRETFDGLAEEHGIAISYPHVSEKSLSIIADNVKLSQIFINLLSNAIRHTPSGGRIDIEAEEKSSELIPTIAFAVRDTGEGIPPDYLESIFESFRQVDGGHTRRHGGTGLGLAITKHLVELHGGTIWVESELGKGSVFRLVLPKDGSRMIPADDDFGKGAYRTDHSIVVVVDDERSQLTLIDTVLRRSGYATELIVDPKQAFERIEKIKPACVLLDVMMPEVSGIELLKQLRGSEVLTDMPVVVVSAYHSNEMVVKRLNAKWLPKPWNARSLLETVDGIFST